MSSIRSTLVRAGAAVTAAGLCIAATALGASAVTGPDAPAATAAGTTKASVSLAGPSSATYGTTVKLTGTAWRTGTTTKLVNATIWLQRATHGGSTWTNVTYTHTSSTGTFAFNVQLNTPYDYRARYGGSATYTVAVSPRIFPIVRQNVLFDSIRDTNWALGTMQVGGRVYPAPAKGTRIWLQRYNTSTKAWSNFMSTVSTGTNAFLMKGNFGGNVGTYRIYAPQHGYYAYNYSRQVTFAHYKWRGAFKKAIVDGTAGEYYIYTATESPTRDEFEMRVRTSALDPTTLVVDSRGCKSAQVAALNFTNEQGQTPATGRFGALNGSTWVRGPWTLGPGASNSGSASLSNVPALTLRLERVSGGDMYVYGVVNLLCTN
jgi:hypothetical protein